MKKIISPKELITLIRSHPENIEFEDVINTINKHYYYTPCHFTNGMNGEIITNKAGENEGSCKIFYFAKLNKLNQQETLACFGKYYRHDVLENSDKNNHQNIRTFLIHGCNGINFENQALKEK